VKRPAAVQAPPQATVFRAAGKTYWLYMGPQEMVALQRHWGLTRLSSDTREDWTKKKEVFEDRLNGSAMEDQITIMRHALARWASVQNGTGPGELTDEKMGEILAGIESGPVPKGAKPKAGFMLTTELFLRFICDCFGIKSDDEEPKGEPDPNVSSGEVSTPSTS